MRSASESKAPDTRDRTDVSRERILTAARDCFDRFGFRKANVTDIARSAGLAPGTIYVYFKSKEDLYLQVVERSNQRWIESAREALAEPGTAPERLARLGAASVRYSQQDAVHRSILERDTEMVVVARLDGLYRRVREINVQLMAEVIRDGIAEGDFRGEDPEKLALVLFLCGRALMQEERSSYAELIPVFVDLTMNGLAGR